MARKPTGNPVGPPKKTIDWDQFEQCCALQCTQIEAAQMLKVNETTLRDRVVEHYGEEYSAVYKKLSSVGKVSLRRYQFIQAKTKPNMAIWLGKHWLDQWDRVEHVNAPKQEDVDLKEKFYLIAYENELLKKELNALKSKANPELQRSDSQVQPVDRSSELR